MLLVAATLAAGWWLRRRERAPDPLDAWLPIVALVPPDGHAGLDAAYLGILPDDAIPVLVEALSRLPTSEGGPLLLLLRDRKVELASDPALTSPAAWNLGRERARAALSTLP